MPKILKKIFKTIIDILIFIIFLILIVIIFAKLKMLNDNNNYFELFGYSIFNVATGSMEPAISQNDVILVKKHYTLFMITKMIFFLPWWITCLIRSELVRKKF